MVAGRVPGDRHRDQAEQGYEHARQAGGLQLQGAADDGLRSAGGDQPGVAVDQRPAAASGRGAAAESRQSAARPQPGSSRPAQQPGQGGGEPRAARPVQQVQRVHAPPPSPSATNVRPGVFSASLPTATLSPCSRASGLGGQPGIHTSTGRTAPTWPCTNGSDWYTPPSAHAPVATTTFGPGIA